MNSDLIHKLQYSHEEQKEAYPLPLPLKDSFQLISDFFSKGINHKLCLVFPSKELATQWLSLPLTLSLIEKEYKKNYEDIYGAYKLYKPKQKLWLNNAAIVEWVKGDNENLVFKTKGRTSRANPWENTDGDVITINATRINNLRPASEGRSLSSPKTVYENLAPRSIAPIDELLGINSNGNLIFQKQFICLIGVKKRFEESVKEISLNNYFIPEYFIPGVINENGEIEPAGCNFLYTNNVRSLALHLTHSRAISAIIIDGYSFINEKGMTDFADIEALDLKIPTILITDLSELETFENIDSHGFEFYSFTKENLKPCNTDGYSPFNLFEKKLHKYSSFKFHKEICSCDELETIIQKIHSIENDDSNDDLINLKISLIQLTNIVSRIASIPNKKTATELIDKLVMIESRFENCHRWLGESSLPIAESISHLKSIIKIFSSEPSDKCQRLKRLLNESHYDYIICPTTEEAKMLKEYLYNPSYKQTPSVISIADVNDNLLYQKGDKAILTGWPKSSNINRILSSFLFSSVTVLFYGFENKYFISLQKRNKRNSDKIKATIDSNGIRSANKSSKSNGFDELYLSDEAVETINNTSFDIIEHELKLDGAQYSRYSAKGSLTESCKAKRIDFENDIFLYSVESHKFLVINELLDSAKQNPVIHNKKFEALRHGDVIAFINTDRDVLAELVQKSTKPKELSAITEWTHLWKNLLRDYYSTIQYDFKRLIGDLRKNDCNKHEATIRNWLQDDNLIGPDNDNDLLSIALLTGSELLYKNVTKVRESINQMISLRFQAATIVRDKIKNELMAISDTSIVNTDIEIQDLGTVAFLKVNELKKEAEEIDKKYVHRLIAKEII